MFYSIILTVLLASPRHYMDREEPQAEREARFAAQALALDWAAQKLTCRGYWDKPDCRKRWNDPLSFLAIAITILREESGLARHVHADKCRVHRGECDRGRAKSMFQIQATELVPREEWQELGGIDAYSTFLATQAAVRVLVHTRGCWKSHGVAGMFSMYATGSTCRGPKHIRARAHLSKRLELRLKILLTEDRAMPE